MEHADLDHAILLAAEAFDGRTDRQGRPYVAHAIRVMHAVDGTDAKTVAMLHDVIEWGSLTSDALVDAGFSEPVLAAVDALTCREGEPLAQHVERIRASALASVVKITDLRDNAQAWRLAELDEPTRERLLEKYRTIAELLGTSLAAVTGPIPV